MIITSDLGHNVIIFIALDIHLKYHSKFTKTENLLGCYTVSSGIQFLMFQIIVVALSSGSSGPRRVAAWQGRVYYIGISDDSSKSLYRCNITGRGISPNRRLSL